MVSTADQSASLLGQIIHLFDSPVLSIDVNREIICLNRNAEIIIGCTSEEAKGQFFATALGVEKWADKIYPKDFLLDSDSSDVWEDLQLQGESETNRPVHIRRRVLQLEDGFKAMLVSLVPRDPWENRQQESVVPSPMVFFKTDPDGCIVSGQSFFEEALGYEAGRLKGKTLEELISEQHGDLLKHSYKDILAGQEMRGREFYLINSRNEQQPFWIWLFLEMGEFSKSVNVRGIAVNLVLERSLAFALEASEERFSLLFRDSSDPVMILSQEGEVLLVNHTFERVTGLRASQLFQNEKGWHDFVHEKDIPKLRESLQECMSCSEEKVVEVRFMTTTGEEVWFEHKMSTLHDENGNGCGILAVSRNVDRRKHLEERLRGKVESMERKQERAQGLISKLKTFFSEVSNLPTDLDRYIQGISRILYEMYEPEIVITTLKSAEGESRVFHSAASAPEAMIQAWKKREPEGMCALVLESSLPIYCNTMHEIAPYMDDPYINEFKFKTYLGAPMLDPNGGMYGTIALLDTESRAFDNLDVELITVAALHVAARMKVQEHEEVKSRLEDHLLRAQKMEAVGMLAGGVAHDFNNILTGILGFSSHLLTKVEPETDIHRDLQLIEQSAVRAAELTRQLLAFARKKNFAKKPVEVNRVIEGVLGIIKPSISKDIGIGEQLTRDLPTVLGDSGQLNQVIMNLCLNGAEAMAGTGGTLNILSEVRPLTKKELDYFPDSLDDDYICISISDTGMGMSQHIKDHIFDPFFTTRSEQGGSGLGLSIVYGIVNNHGGEIFLETEENRGTTFTVFLPIHHAKVVDEVGVSPEILDGSESILVVDDELIIRQMVMEILDDRGYKVSTAGSGSEAVNLLRDPKHNFEMILLDIIMPNMDGEATFHEIRKVNRGIPILLTSGYALPEKRDRLIDAGAEGIIYKPYKNVELAAEIRQVLDRKAALSKS